MPAIASSSDLDWSASWSYDSLPDVTWLFIQRGSEETKKTMGEGGRVLSIQIVNERRTCTEHANVRM